MPEPVATQVFAAVPARDNDQMAVQLRPFEHAQNHHAGSAFSIIVLQWSFEGQQAPGVMRGLGKALFPFQFLDQSQRVGLG